MTQIRIPIEQMRAFEEALPQVLGSSIREEIPAQIGNPVTGNIFVDNATRTQVYVHGFGSEPSGTNAISASGIPKDKLRFGQPILIKLMDSGNYRFVGIDDTADNIYSSGLTEEATQEPVYPNQIRWGTLQPYTGLQAMVTAAMYGDDWVDDLISDAFDGTAQDTSASSITVPTTNNRQIGVLVQMDASTGTLEYKQSSEFIASISPTRAYTNDLLPLPDSNRNRIGYVFLKAGMSEITKGDIWVVPNYIENVATSAGVGYPNPVTSTLTIQSGYTLLVKDSISITTGSIILGSGSVLKVF